MRGIIWKHEAKLTMTKVLFLQDAKLLLKVTLRFGGRGLHALEMCLVQGYLMTALDALPLWFIQRTLTQVPKKKKKRTLHSHRARSGECWIQELK